eukprot:10570985-Lingulodinium_polyedra.AAC.1
MEQRRQYCPQWLQVHAAVARAASPELGERFSRALFPDPTHLFPRVEVPENRLVRRYRRPAL